MPVIPCPCGAKLTVSDELIGKKVKCPTCSVILQTRAASSNAKPTAPQPAPAAPANPFDPVDLELFSELDTASTDTAVPWRRWLSECQANLGTAPRKFDEQTTEYLAIESGWVYGLLFWVPLCKLMKNSRQRNIFGNGVVVWAHVIQANNVLWSPSNNPDDDAPGELVFANDPQGQVTPESLGPVAVQLGQLRGADHGDKALNRIGNYLEAENVRAFGWEVPRSVSRSATCYISTTMFLRKHLPNGFLNRPYFPIVITPSKPHFAMPLPARFWSPELMAWWMSDPEYE